MTDRTFTATELHELLSGKGTAADKVQALCDMIIPMLQKRPTLADMTEEERAACRRAQADVAYRSVRYVIANPLDDDDEVALISADGDICWVSPDRVTPRPDLPRLEWPGDTPAPALPNGWKLADHKDYGRVIVTTSIPNHDGRVYFVFPSAWDSLGYSGGYCTPDKLTYIDQEADQ